MNLRFLEIARLELDEAVDYYNGEFPGLGEVFLAEVLSTLDRISRFPEAWPPLGENARRCKTRRFPYGLIYLVEGQDIIVLAVGHLHRDPDHWKDRTVPF